MLFRKKQFKDQWLKRSFSQAGEDLVIKFIFDTLKIDKPSFLDIGAHHPFYMNNTAIFFEKGSRGINIEPDPELFKAFPENRKGDINLNCGVGYKDQVMTLHVFDAPSLNTFSEDEANRIMKEHSFKVIRKIPIQVFSIQTILQQHASGIFPDFLNLDVEGLDESIIRSINFEKTKPIVICLETISYSENGRGIKNTEMISYLQDKGYMVYADTYINTIFLLREKWLRD